MGAKETSFDRYQRLLKRTSEIVHKVKYETFRVSKEKDVFMGDLLDTLVSPF